MLEMFPEITLVGGNINPRVQS